jgi:hypothetical protein
LSKPLGRNGFTATSLGRARPPFCGACSPPCTFLISLMIEGAVASLPVKGSPYDSPWGLHPNGFSLPGLLRGSPEILPTGTLGTLDPHNFASRPWIEVRSKAKL